MNTKMINFRNSLADTFTDIVRSDVYNLFARSVDFSKLRFGSYPARAIASMTVTGDLVGCSEISYHAPSRSFYALVATQAPVMGGKFSFEFEGELADSREKSGDWTFKWSGMTNRRVLIPDADAYLAPYKFFSTIPAYLPSPEMVDDTFAEAFKERFGITLSICSDKSQDWYEQSYPVSYVFEDCHLNQFWVPLKNLSMIERLDFVRDLAQFECYAPILDSWNKFPYIPMETRILWYTTFGIMHSTSSLIHDLMKDFSHKDVSPEFILRQICTTAIQAANRYTHIFIPNVGSGRYECFDYSTHLENFMKILDADEMRYLG